ncbi:hypothetical protein L6452_27991 [Arctium lappa]|uniref:Uncharacterized protein n=1 Tax=Arctium lappa TaxID=4217 RepID=A0ACB8ZYJ9_ARCLA|nr:hypothetical protein L6452_27991 [Arctium lappa]
MSGDSDDISSVGSPPPPTLADVLQAMLRSLVNHNHRLLEENTRLMEKLRKKEYNDLTQKLWDEKLVVQKLEKTVKYLKGRCPCNR